MKSLMAAFVAAAVIAVFAASANADQSTREVRSAVDAYLASAEGDASLVGGPGSAGYDGGFWIRGGSFLLKINLTIQARYEYWDWDDKAAEADPGGDLSGFSVPRVTLRLSGDATCDVSYYASLEFGHHGTGFDLNDPVGLMDYPDIAAFTGGQGAAGVDEQAFDGDPLREAWIQYEVCPQAAIRMGLVQTAATRQLMTPPEMQQFIDISMASVYVGQLMPGYSDRNRDYGIMVHGKLGCDGEWSYMATVTNGDGAAHRNVLDGSTDDNLAYSARLNWDIMGHMGYEEGALRQHECEWTAALGAWIYVYNDVRLDNVHTKYADRTVWGVDGAVGYGGWSLTAAYNSVTYAESDESPIDATGFSYLVQLGYLFPDTAWEIAARYSAYNHEFDDSFIQNQVIVDTFGATEIGVAVNYYIDGHGDKLSADVALVTAEDDGNILSDVYAAYNTSGDSDAMLVRFQWQLAL